MKGDMDKSLFFITLAMVCVWLVVDTAIGKKHLISFLSTLFPFIDAPSDSPTKTETEQETQAPATNKPKGANLDPNKDKKPTMGSNTPIITPAVISGPPFGAVRK